MRIAVFTSNAVRHKFVANALANSADDALIVSECRKNDSVNIGSMVKFNSSIDEHFQMRSRVESEFFSGNDLFFAKALPLLAGEVNLSYTYDIIKDFKPDVMFVFGSSIIREPLLSLVSPGRFINLHLGLSPYYRGSGTNFWPFVNDQLDYVGSTILHIDAGVDTGDIIAHVRPDFELGDNVHIAGCKVIRGSAATLVEIINLLKAGKELNRVKQWEVEDEYYYRNCDFNEDILLRYKNNLEGGLIKKYLAGPKRKLRLISLS